MGFAIMVGGVSTVVGRSYHGVCKGIGRVPTGLAGSPRWSAESPQGRISFSKRISQTRVSLTELAGSLSGSSRVSTGSRISCCPDLSRHPDLTVQISSSGNLAENPLKIRRNSAKNLPIRQKSAENPPRICRIWSQIANGLGASALGL